MTFVEVAMKVVAAGLSSEGPEGQLWARGLEAEVSTLKFTMHILCIYFNFQVRTAITKGVWIASSVVNKYL